MTRRATSGVKRLLTLAAFGAVTLIAAGPLAAAPTNVRVNQVTTLIPEEFPALAVSDQTFGPNPYLEVIWEGEHRTGTDTSLLNVAGSVTRGASWVQRGALPQGTEDFAGSPDVAWDPKTRRFYYVTESCFPPAHKCPPAVLSRDPASNAISAPVDIFTGIRTSDQEVARHPRIAVDAGTGNRAFGRIYVAYTLFDLDPAGSQIVLQTSNDGGVTWTAPVQVSDADSSFGEQPAVDVTSNGTVVVSFMAYDPIVQTYRLSVDRSTDGGATFGTDHVVLPSLLATGSSANCGNQGTRFVLPGNIGSFPYPNLDMATDKIGYLTWHGPGSGSAQPDAFVSRTVDGGATWSGPVAVGTGSRDQFDPVVAAGPAGEVIVAYYDRQADPANQRIGVNARFSYDYGVHWSATQLVSSTTFLPGTLNPNFYTADRNCEFWGKIDAVFPGSGAHVVWSDGRDTRLVGNNSVDPSIYSAHPLAPTTLSAGVTKGSRSLTVSGAVAPKVAGGKVTVTLYRKVSGTYAKVTAKTATLSSGGTYALGFTRPAAGACEVIAKFPGAPEYLSSSITKTFAC